jgi:hypothetical protein
MKTVTVFALLVGIAATAHRPFNLTVYGKFLENLKMGRTYQVLTAVSVTIQDLRDMSYRRFGEAYCLHFGVRVLQHYLDPEMEVGRYSETLLIVASRHCVISHGTFISVLKAVGAKYFTNLFAS